MWVNIFLLSLEENIEFINGVIVGNERLWLYG